MKYKLIKKWYDKHSIGQIMYCSEKEFLIYKIDNTTFTIAPHETALLVHAGFLEEVKEPKIEL